MGINAVVRKYVPQDAEGFSKWLIDNGACSMARIWAEGKDLRTVWNTCEQGNWLCWLLAVSEYTPALDARFHLDYNEEVILELKRTKAKESEYWVLIDNDLEARSFELDLEIRSFELKKHMADWIRARVPYPFGNAEEGTQVNSSALGNEEKI
jgi:hypothetical protein